MFPFIHAVFVSQSKCRPFTRGSQTMENFLYVNCDFCNKRAHFENDIASEKWPQNQNTFIKVNDLGVILLEMNFIRSNAHNFLLKLLIIGVAFFLGHPV